MLATTTINDATLIAAAVGAGVVLLAYAALIAWPAWTAYGRTWERFSALFLSLYVLVAMLGIGAGIGLGVFYLFGENI